MIIAFVYNLKKDLSESQAEFDSIDTINRLSGAIKNNGYEVLECEADEDLYDKLRKNKNIIDLIFNFSETVGLGVNREAQVPMIAEILGIDCTGPDPLGAAIMLNKGTAKDIWKAHGIPTAEYEVWISGNEKLKLTKFPMIVKPIGEGSSMGIKTNCVVNNEKELSERAGEIISMYHQPVLIETFLTGREFTVTLIGNGENIEVLPLIEFNYDHLPPEIPKIFGYEAKWDTTHPAYSIDEKASCPAVVDKKLKNEIEKWCKLAFLAIGGRDWGRVDVRLDSKGKVNILEINCPPGMLPNSDYLSYVPRSAYAAGMNFDQLVGKIIKTALKRVGKAVN